MGKIQACEPLWRRLRLRIHKLQLVTMPLLQGSCCLGTDADPVHPRCNSQSAIGLHSNLKARSMEGFHQSRIELQHGFATGANDVGPFRSRSISGYGLAQIRSIGKTPSPLAIQTHKICVTEIADGACPIPLQAIPEVASSKAAEHGWTPRSGALTLQCIKNFFYGIHTWRRDSYPCISADVALSDPSCRLTLSARAANP